MVFRREGEEMPTKEEIQRARLVMVREAAERARALDSPNAGTKGAAQGQVRAGGHAVPLDKSNTKT
jgi:hypothetical protein